MQPTISNNLGLFSLSGPARPAYKQPVVSTSVDEKNSTLRYLVSELELNTKDSIARALNMLSFKKIDAPTPLVRLAGLHQSTVLLDVNFAKDADALKNEATKELEKLLK